jgi:ketosteroid isomerase-like protein
MAAEDEVRELENKRIKACTTRDRALLDTLFDESMTHVHMNGHTENRAELIDGIMTRTRFHTIERPDLKIRVVGDAAVLTGTMQQELTTAAGDKRQMKARVTQVAKKTGDGWRFLAFQATEDKTAK